MAQRRRTEWKVQRQGNQLYIMDNVVRKPQFEADPELEYNHGRQSQLSRERRNKEEFSKQMSPKYIGFLVRCTLIAFIAGAAYLWQIGQVNTIKQEISTLETDVADMKSTNDEMESNMNSSIDVESIRRQAIDELGMVYANQGQIITYDYEESEYVRQYEAIPASN